MSFLRLRRFMPGFFAPRVPMTVPAISQGIVDRAPFRVSISLVLRPRASYFQGMNPGHRPIASFGQASIPVEDIRSGSSYHGRRYSLIRRASKSTTTCGSDRRVPGLLTQRDDVRAPPTLPLLERFSHSFLSMERDHLQGEIAIAGRIVSTARVTIVRTISRTTVGGPPGERTLVAEICDFASSYDRAKWGPTFGGRA
jgi:hypothetical protein